ncbi:hypothetical protein AGDE_14920 [Angomonas deanei]|nr:hypothetical protein AGDE_14920 [Angomonas deanei]|eukprot:EPY19995.1 hypothetical protein AGDE_14920 [Angomonas deanei]
MKELGEVQKSLLKSIRATLEECKNVEDARHLVTKKIDEAARAHSEKESWTSKAVLMTEEKMKQIYNLEREIGKFLELSGVRRGELSEVESECASAKNAVEYLRLLKAV